MSDQRVEDTGLMTLGETARFLRLKVSTLRAWRLQKRNLPFVRLGRKIFVRRADAEALIAANVEHPDPLRAV
jgi:excisionase family DNA binding protein